MEPCILLVLVGFQSRVVSVTTSNHWQMVEMPPTCTSDTTQRQGNGEIFGELLAKFTSDGSNHGWNNRERGRERKRKCRMIFLQSVLFQCSGYQLDKRHPAAWMLPWRPGMHVRWLWIHPQLGWAMSTGYGWHHHGHQQRVILNIMIRIASCNHVRCA